MAIVGSWVAEEVSSYDEDSPVSGASSGPCSSYVTMYTTMAERPVMMMVVEQRWGGERDWITYCLFSREVVVSDKSRQQPQIQGYRTNTRLTMTISSQTTRRKDSRGSMVVKGHVEILKRLGDQEESVLLRPNLFSKEG